ncbi:MAG: WbqC family protein [Dysgonamonadaceae bacterium]|jgi:hypothetical protein|nr:WbqC family protein [Dysgonamonadaceae bacterium]
MPATDKTVLLSTAYLPPVDYFLQLNSGAEILIDRHCNYVKQTYRNRCVIAAANELQTISIPVVKPDSPKCPDCDVRISDHGAWRHLHWNAIASAYRSSPFFEYYEDDFRPFYEKKYEFLFDFNEELRILLCNLLDIAPKVAYTQSFIEKDDEHYLDLREAVNPKKPPVSASFKPYYQVFEQKYGFQPNLSIIDLLFNMGNEAALFLNCN